MLTVQLMQTWGTGFVLDLYPEIIIIYSHSQPPPSRNTSICTLDAVVLKEQVQDISV